MKAVIENFFVEDDGKIAAGNAVMWLRHVCEDRVQG